MADQCSYDNAITSEIRVEFTHCAELEKPIRCGAFDLVK
jgi:hypothetical protein